MDLDLLTLEIARKKLDTAPSEGKIRRPRLGTGGGFADVFFWDTAFTSLWAKYFANELPVQTSLDNLYRLAEEDGYICRQYLPIGEPKYYRTHPHGYSPPLLTWAELELYEQTGDLERLKEVYPKLQAFYRSYREMFLLPDDLMFCDAMGSGMDNLPRWPRDWQGDSLGMPLTEKDIHPSVKRAKAIVARRKLPASWNRQGRFIDASCQAALDARCMHRLAGLLGDGSGASAYHKDYGRLKDAINQYCWCDEDSFYFDLAEHEQIRRFHVGAFWALIAGVCPEDKVEAFASHLTDPKRFGRNTPVPSLSADDPDYDPGGSYWVGSSWAPTTYMVLRGLKAVGMSELAKALGTKFYNVICEVAEETGTLWENYSPDASAPGSMSGPDFVGWTGLASVAVPREIL